MRQSRRGLTMAFALATCVLALRGGTAHAAGDDEVPDVFALQGQGETDVGARSLVTTPKVPASGAAGRAASASVERKLVPACPGTGLADGESGALCGAATQYCAANGSQGVSFWLFTREPGAGWRLAGQQCLTAEEAGAAAAAAVVTADDFRRLPLPAGVVHIQPGNGRTLVNVPTNVYVDASVRIIPTVVLGRPVRVRATPVGYRWSFGDGAGLQTADPGAPYPDLRTTHVYTAAGAVRIGLTTTYRGEFSVAGGVWLPIDGTADASTPPVVLTVVAAHGELVDSPLPSP